MHMHTCVRMYCNFTNYRHACVSATNIYTGVPLGSQELARTCTRENGPSQGYVDTKRDADRCHHILQNIVTETNSDLETVKMQRTLSVSHDGIVTSCKALLLKGTA